VKQLIKDIIVRAIGLFLATFFAGTGVGAIATNGDWFLGSIIGVGAAFAIVLTMVGVSMTWSGNLTAQDVANAFRAAVAKSAEGNDNLQAALKVTEDGDFDWDDVEFEDADNDLFESETEAEKAADLAEFDNNEQK
jgi:hypothetical protein